MKSIISLMTDIEKEAADIVNTASNKKKFMYKQSDEKMTEIDKHYKNKYKQDIDKLNSKCSAALKKEIEKAEQISKKNIEELEKMYESKHDKYIDSLFNKIIRM
ncbi:MAG: hypothetical protein E7262_02835 [Lachnospiraceae bacterium]|nr:hypothetical protein [Lachnospiraceae bacterium]